MKFTNVKKWLAMLLVVCSMLSLVACGKSDKDPAGDDSEKGTKVAVVFASSGLGDKSFNDALYGGMKKAESTMGIQWVYSEPKDDAEYEGLISGYADSGDCDLIICLGGSQSSSLENVAPNYPQQKFVILDAVVEGDNIRSYTWRDQELGFLAGFLGASLSDTNTLGFIGAHDIPLCNLGAAGMIGSNMAQTALMMRLTPHLCLYDPYAPALEGVAEELRHCAFKGVDITFTSDVKEALTGASYIVSSGGAARKAGMTREDLLKGNAEIAAQFGKDVHQYCPNVKHIVVIFNPADITGLITLLYSGLKPSQVTTLACLLYTSDAADD